MTLPLNTLTHPWRNRGCTQSQVKFRACGYRKRDRFKRLSDGPSAPELGSRTQRPRGPPILGATEGEKRPPLVQRSLSDSAHRNVEPCGVTDSLWCLAGCQEVPQSTHRRSRWLCSIFCGVIFRLRKYQSAVTTQLVIKVLIVCMHSLFFQ